MHEFIKGDKLKKRSANIIPSQRELSTTLQETLSNQRGRLIIRKLKQNNTLNKGVKIPKTKLGNNASGSRLGK